MKKLAIITASNREAELSEMINAWNFPYIMGDLTITHFIIHDVPKTTLFNLGKENGCIVQIYDHERIDSDLGENSWIIPKRTDAIRSYGFLKAYQDGYDYFITLDDDCLPHFVPDIHSLDGKSPAESFILGHVNKLEQTSPRWVSTTKKIAPRGYPYGDIGDESLNVLNMGFWSNVADLDAIHQLVHGAIELEPNELNPVPSGVYYPMCNMNLSFRREIAPAMYHLLMGIDSYEFDRYGDIWCGILSKKIIDHHKWTATAGSPIIRHNRASNVWSNLRKEAPGYYLNEHFWKVVDSINIIDCVTVMDCYRTIGECFENDVFAEYFVDKAVKPSVNQINYFVNLGKAMQIWARMFE